MALRLATSGTPRTCLAYRSREFLSFLVSSINSLEVSQTRRAFSTMRRARASACSVLVWRSPWNLVTVKYGFGLLGRTTFHWDANGPCYVSLLCHERSMAYIPGVTVITEPERVRAATCWDEAHHEIPQVTSSRLPSLPSRHHPRLLHVSWGRWKLPLRADQEVGRCRNAGRIGR